MKSKQYIWDSVENKEQARNIHFLSIFNHSPNILEELSYLVSKPLPFTNRIAGMSPYLFDLHSFAPQEIVDCGKTYSKPADTSLYLLKAGELDNRAIARMNFLEGKFVNGWTLDDADCTLDEIRGELNGHFRSHWIITFGDYLPQFISNSNLPEKQKEAVRELTAGK